MFRKQFYVVSDFKIAGHGNPDNNLELLYSIQRQRGSLSWYSKWSDGREIGV
jgi:hypothetical protein